jgi:hypothetical protein
MLAFKPNEKLVDPGIEARRYQPRRQSIIEYHCGLADLAFTKGWPGIR